MNASDKVRRESDVYRTPTRRRLRAKDVAFLKGEHSMAYTALGEYDGELEKSNKPNDLQYNFPASRLRSIHTSIVQTAQVRVQPGEHEDVVDAEYDSNKPRYRSRSGRRNKNGESILFFDSVKSQE